MLELEARVTTTGTHATGPSVAIHRTTCVSTDLLIYLSHRQQPAGTDHQEQTMSDYTELVEAITAILEEHDGNVPDTGVPLLHGPTVYAAYAYLNSEQADELSDWYSDAEEAFQGEYGDDEDFAQQYAEETSPVDVNDQAWPLTCIDWTHAARELMYDYSSHDGFYFRDL